MSERVKQLMEHAEGADLSRPPCPLLHDVEGARVPDGLPPIVDAHVHAFPAKLFTAIQRWFDAHGWPIRYRMSAEEVVDFLPARGMAHVVVFAYAHKAGLADELNRFLAALVADRPSATGLATVFPGEPGSERILADAFALGLRGVKIHCHVQCVSADAAEMDAVAGACAEAGLPIVMHAGREPASPAYRCDTHAICSVDRVERLLSRHPRLTLVIPHLGVDELDGYRRLASRHALFVDTTMMLADYFPGYPPTLDGFPPERVLYGTDFPNLPYAWDRELKNLVALGLAERDLARVLGSNAAELFGISLR
jgi:predicted TIM-barrel fold metal-dependent hydrolase